MSEDTPVTQDPPESNWLVAVGGRKFVISVLSLVLVVFFIPVGGDAKLAFVTSIVGIFAGANVVQKAALALITGKKDDAAQ